MRNFLSSRLGRVLATALSLAVAGTAAAQAQTRDKVVVASKIDTEGGLLGHMIALVLEKQGIPVENRVQLGPTKVVRTAILSGEIDLRADPVVRVWQHALGAPRDSTVDSRTVLRDWRACPQLLVSRKGRSV